MLINADLSLSAVVTPEAYQWTPSPQGGVERVMLDRAGAEAGRATSIVRYAPGSSFRRHEHPGGEEILVLAGTFSEGVRHYPAGWYLRSPPGSSHQPSSAEGATIFVKLCQMTAAENQLLRTDTNDKLLWKRMTDRLVCALYSGGGEEVSLHQLDGGAALSTHGVCGTEVLVLEGTLVRDQRVFTAGSWMRWPHDEAAGITAGPAGARVYLKTGHLSQAPAAIAA